MNFGSKLIHNCVKALIGGIEWVLSYKGKTKCNINPNWWQIFLNFLVLMTKTAGTMTLKNFWPKICTLRGLQARIADFGLKGQGFDPPTNHTISLYPLLNSPAHYIVCRTVEKGV